VTDFDELERRAMDNFEKMFSTPIANAVMMVQTQYGIIKYAEAMAQVLAEAAIASRMATGDVTNYALGQWLKVIELRAKQIIREREAAEQEQPRPTPLTGRGLPPPENSQ